MTQKQAQQNIPCPECNSTMAATQTERGPFLVCWHCGHEIQFDERGTVDE